jgi:hypothetical protein
MSTVGFFFFSSQCDNVYYLFTYLCQPISEHIFGVTFDPAVCLNVFASLIAEHVCQPDG